MYWTAEEQSRQHCWTYYEPPVSFFLFSLSAKDAHNLLKLFSVMQSVSPPCPSSQSIKPALQPLLAHDAPPALCQNTTPSLCERGSLPDFVSTRLPTKRPATVAGSGEFSFFWSLNTVIASVAGGLGEIMPREQIGDLPFTVKKNNGAVHGLAQ